MMDFIIVKLAVEGKWFSGWWCSDVFGQGSVECTESCAGATCNLLGSGSVTCPAGQSGD